MSQRPKHNRASVRMSLALATSLFPLPLFAQAEAEPQPPAETAEPAPEAGALTEAGMVTADTPAMPEAKPMPETLSGPKLAQADSAPPPPPEETTIAETAKPDPGDEPLSVNVWGRLGNYYTSPAVGDGDAFVNAEVNLLLSGKIHEYVGWQADFVAVYGPATSSANGNISGTAEILDLIGKFELHDTFNVWFGRMLVPSDRSNFSGAWFMSPWNYPGFYDPSSAPVGPRQGPFGRNDGATVWGQLGGGIFKYYAGVFDMHAPTDSPLFSGRLNLALLNPEPGYYHSSTYYGGKDIVAIGVGAQYKKEGSTGVAPMGGVAPAPDDYTGFNADLLVEKTLGSAGTVSLEGAFYLFSGDNEPIDYHYLALLSYLLPMEVGIGKLQPLVRFQQAKPSDDSDSWNIIDAQLGYAIKEYSARLALGYQKIDSTAMDSDGVFLGIQLQK